MSRILVAGLLLAAIPGPASLLAQGTRSPARRMIFEWGPTGTLIIGDSLRFGVLGGGRVAARTLGGTRGSLSLGAGVLGDSLTGRIEGAVEYQLAPRARGKPGVYVGGGLSGVFGAGSGGYLLLFVGLEQSPGSGHGWAIEAGLGGGIRIRAAYHFRR